MIKLAKILSEIRILNPHKMSPGVIKELFDGIISKINDENRREIIGELNKRLYQYTNNGNIESEFDGQWIQKLDPSRLAKVYQDLLFVKQKCKL